LGHALDIHQPDRPPFDPPCALRCLEEGIRYAREFLVKKLKGTPNPLFDNYTPASAAVDQNFADIRKGQFFNQLAPDTSTPARTFLTDLIRSQIDAYTASIDVSPNFLARFTADQVIEERLRPRLQGAIDRARLPFRVPGRSPMPFLNTPTLTLPNAPGIPPLSRRIPGFRPEGNDGFSPVLDFVLFPVLPDSQIPLVQAMTNYTVRIRTGDGAAAGTDSNIFLSITGTREGSIPIGEQRLNWQISGKAFQPGQTDTFVLERLQTVGEIRSVTIRSDGQGASPGWLLGSVEIGAPGIATRTFTLNEEIGSGRLAVILDR
jgi:hypothetical protein